MVPWQSREHMQDACMRSPDLLNITRASPMELAASSSEDRCGPRT